MRLKALLAMTLAGVLASAACFGATVFTSRAAFDAAITGFANPITEGFDSYAAGSPAETIGCLDFYISGLASDGITWSGLSGMITDAFPPTSPSNVLGLDSPSYQFLAGNSDEILIWTSYPVSALGCYLIGNPSPTGDPPIPFWRMHANTSSGFDAYSATDPLYSLGLGNDVYFLGIVSAMEPFNQVTIYSNNDLAAVYSFNVDDITYANSPPPATIAQAKAMTSGTVLVGDGIVTRVHPDRFYIETLDRTAGLMVKGTGAIRGNAIALVGTVGKNDDDECFLQLTHIADQTQSTAPAPLAMGSRSVGGSTTVGQQIPPDGGLGPNNVGLDVCIWGRVTGVDPDEMWMTLDDGAKRPLVEGYTGVVVQGAINPREAWVGRFVRVTGSISIAKYEQTSIRLPMIRVAAPEDVYYY